MTTDSNNAVQAEIERLLDELIADLSKIPPDQRAKILYLAGYGPQPALIDHPVA